MGIVLLDSNNVFFDEKIVLLEFLLAYKNGIYPKFPNRCHLFFILKLEPLSSPE